MNINLKDLIGQKQLALEKINDKLADYDDPNWIAERKRSLLDKREVIEQEILLLTGADQRLSAQEGEVR